MVKLYRYLSFEYSKIVELDSKFMDLTTQLSSEDDQSKQKEIEAELNHLRKQVAEKGQLSRMFDRFQKALEEVKETKELLEEAKGDEDLTNMLQEDLNSILGTEEEYGSLETLQEEVLDLIIPETEADKNNACILEVMQAAGGSESSLFAQEIYEMYKNFGRQMGFKMKEE